MIVMLRRLLEFSGNQKKNLILSFVFSFLDSIFALIPVMAVLTVLTGVLSALEGGQMPLSTVWISFGVMVLSITGRIVFGNASSIKRTIGSFDLCAEKRLEIGERLKRAPMGYFSQNRLGDITAAATTTLGDIESNAVSVLDKVFNGFIHAIVVALWLLVYEWHIGVITLLGIAVALLVYAAMQKAAKRLSPKRQAAQAGLVTAILEYVQGMGVVKAFGLGEKSGRTVDEAIYKSADANIRLESVFSSLTGVYQTVFKLAASSILAVAPYLLTGGEIDLVKCLLLVISGFLIYSHVELVGSMASVARVVEASLDRMETVLDTPVLDENGTEITPQHFGIEMKQVSFAYGDKEIIHDVSFTIPENTTCAIVGPSGSGKTTLCSLIARFWDVQRGQVMVGGHDVRDYTCDSLLRSFSIVFQQVYLFEDSIENNIKFGKPEATHQQVEDAAKRACCHDFIMSLPEGYQTKVGEGGSSLSGGEKQRISIARAILKDAPIIVLDEATASVDPENERELQTAIEELTKNKTILMIAHRLSTVRSADQILVLEDGAHCSARHSPGTDGAGRLIPPICQYSGAGHRLAVGKEHMMDTEERWAEQAQQMRDFHLRELHETGPAWEQLLKEHLAETPGKNVLDVGCGTGFLAILLARSGWSVTAVDSSPSMLTQAKMTAGQLGLSQQITFLERSAEDMGLPDGMFDAVVSRHASWLFSEPEKAYREWQRLLKPEGVLLNLDANWLLLFWENEAAQHFSSDEQKLIAQYGAFQDNYHDPVAMEILKQLPLAFQKRPEWDEALCKAMGFHPVEITFLMATGYRNPFLALRYRAMPTFALKAVKP